MPVNWQDPAVKDRLLAAIIASFGAPINCKEVARIFGEGATYNAIENFLRVPKRKAAELKAEAAGVDGPAPSPFKPKAPRTPKKSKVLGDGVKSGRVTKKTKSTTSSFSGSPTKKEINFDEETIFGISGDDADFEATMDDDDFA